MNAHITPTRISEKDTSEAIKAALAMVSEILDVPESLDITPAVVAAIAEHAADPRNDLVPLLVQEIISYVS